MSDKLHHLRQAALAAADADLAEKDRRKAVALRNEHMLAAQAAPEPASYDEMMSAVGLSKVGVHKALTQAREARAAKK